MSNQCSCKEIVHVVGERAGIGGSETVCRWWVAATPPHPPGTDRPLPLQCLASAPGGKEHDRRVFSPAPHRVCICEGEIKLSGGGGWRRVGGVGGEGRGGGQEGDGRVWMTEENDPSCTTSDF
ncbi:unnamed protein product [Closterium sp. NIES-54]